jgi:hypothetical protein
MPTYIWLIPILKLMLVDQKASIYQPEIDGIVKL